MQDEIAVRVNRISKSFGDVPVLEDVSFEVSDGEVVCIVGPSGSGKSTLLRCINNLESIDRGDIFVFGERIGYADLADGTVRETQEKDSAIARKPVGMVFQSFNLFPHMTALENIIEAPCQVLGHSRNDAMEAGLKLLKRVGLVDRASYYPSGLSGGQQQRVAIARALAMEPKLMLFDEPTSALDPELVGEVLNVIRDLAEDGMTMMVVTHEMNFAVDVADTVIFMDERKIVERGRAKDVVHSPQTTRAQDFFLRVQSR